MDFNFYASYQQEYEEQKDKIFAYTSKIFNVIKKLHLVFPI